MATNRHGYTRPTRPIRVAEPWNPAYPDGGRDHARARYQAGYQAGYLAARERYDRKHFPADAWGQGYFDGYTAGRKAR